MVGLGRREVLAVAGSTNTADLMHPLTKLSKNFRLAEFTKSDTATRLGIDNTPSQDVIDNLIQLCYHICQPISDHYNTSTVVRYVLVRSGYRCLELNRAIGSKDNSQHVKGEAVDLEIMGISNYDLAVWIRDNLDFDQLILEFYEGEEDPNSGWVHVSYSASGNNRKQCLTINSKGLQQGLVK